MEHVTEVVLMRYQHLLLRRTWSVKKSSLKFTPHGIQGLELSLKQGCLDGDPHCAVQ